MYGNKKPYDQRAGVRPIAFVLRGMNGISGSVTLKIRPEHLSVSEPLRASVHQTLGRGIQGWVDHFGRGLPSMTINGNTGWRTSWASGEDGAEAWLSLRSLLREQYPEAIQAAIDAGIDPSVVQLLFIDMLNQNSYSVIPMDLTLRRNKQKPLLFQYTLPMQVIDTDIDAIMQFAPWSGSTWAGLNALKDAISFLKGIADDVKGWITSATEFVNDLIQPIAAVVSDLVAMSNEVFDIVSSTVNTLTNSVSSVINNVIGIASGIATVGANIGRIISTIANLPDDLKKRFSMLASAYTEVKCILANALKPKKIYDNYTGAYGASNCSSTSGGSPASLYNGLNLFEYMRPTDSPIIVSNEAYSAINNLSRLDPVLQTVSLDEVARLAADINSGVTFQEAA